MRIRGILVGALLAVFALIAASCSSAKSPSTKNSGAPTTVAKAVSEATHAVGETTMTFVDTHRTTAAHGPNPELHQRTLVTTIYYPAVGTPAASATTTAMDPNPATQNASPDTTDGPYPLIVFSHGFAATPAIYKTLLTHWAAAGFVVAAPLFPLSGGPTPGGPDAGDVVNQPADVSFVITSMLKVTAGTKGPIAGLVNRHEIGAAGHSNGAITTLGLVANTCCQDHRIKAAAVLAGTEEPFPNGKYRFNQTPPLLLVHGTADELIPYESAIDVFNAAKGPKGLLTVTGGDHMSAAGLAKASAPSVLAATTDFFDAYLRNDTTALQRLPGDATRGATTMRFAAEAGSTVTMPTVPKPVLHLHATANPVNDLRDGQVVTVNWSGFTPGKAVSILQCNPSDKDMSNQQGCDFTHAALLQANPTGTGSATIKVISGKVGDGICDATHPGCFLIVDNASSSDPSSAVFIPLNFAP